MYKQIFFISLFSIIVTGCSAILSKPKYYAPTMAKIDTKEIKIIDEKDTSYDAVYLNILPYINFGIKLDDSVYINKSKITKIQAFRNKEYQNYKNSFDDMWIIYQDKNIYAILDYKIPKIPNLKKWCVYLKAHNKYLCNDKYFIHNSYGDIKDKNIIKKIIALNKEYLNKQGAFYQKWLKAGFTNLSLLKDIDPNTFLTQLFFIILLTMKL